MECLIIIMTSLIINVYYIRNNINDKRMNKGRKNCLITTRY